MSAQIKQYKTWRYLSLQSDPHLTQLLKNELVQTDLQRKTTQQQIAKISINTRRQWHKLSDSDLKIIVISIRLTCRISSESFPAIPSILRWRYSRIDISDSVHNGRMTQPQFSYLFY